VCYNNASALGCIEFSADVLGIKSKNWGAVMFPAQDSSDIAVSQVSKTAGASNVKQPYFKWVCHSDGWLRHGGGASPDPLSPGEPDIGRSGRRPL
jgi:hypothetical protein